MKKFSIQWNLQNKMILLFLVIGLVPLMVISGWIINDAGGLIKREEKAKLLNIRLEQKHKMEGYYQTLKNQVTILAQSPTTGTTIKKFATYFSELEKEFDKKMDKSKELELNNFYSSNKNMFAGESFKNYVPRKNVAKILQHSYILSNPHDSGERERLNSAQETNKYNNFHKVIHPYFRKCTKEFTYYDILLIDLKGNFVYTVEKEIDYATNLVNGVYSKNNIAKLFQKCLETNDKDAVFFEDYGHYVPSGDTPEAFVGAPVYSKGEKVGVFIIQISSVVINAKMTNNNNWKELGLKNTGEMYLIAEDKSYRNNSRFLIESKVEYLRYLKDSGINDKNYKRIDKLNTSILLHTVDNEVINKVIAGKKGFEVREDYRGIEVFSAYAPVRVFDKTWALLVEIDKEEADEDIMSLYRDVFWMVIFVGLIIIAIAFLIARWISKQIIELVDVSEKISKGNLNVNVKVNSNDEIGILANSFRRMITYLQEMAIVSEKISNRNLIVSVEKRSEEDVLSGSFGKMIVSFRHIIKELNTSSAAIFVGLDLQKTSSKEVLDSMEYMTSTMEGITGNVKLLNSNIGETTSAIQKITTSIGSVSENSSALAIASEKTSTIINKVATSIEEIANNASEMNKISIKAVQEAKLGDKIVRKTIDGMSDISENMNDISITIQKLDSSSKKINNIVNVINSISEKTNLLALNAAIEAARAGEHGRGFAVVADEVRKLSERSSESAQEIVEVIKNIQDDVSNANKITKEGVISAEKGMTLADNAGKGLNQIEEAILKVNEMTSIITKTTQEQTLATNEIVEEAKKMNAMVVEVDKATNEQAKDGEQIKKANEVMVKMVKQIKFAVAEQDMANKNIVTITKKVVTDSDLLKNEAEGLEVISKSFTLGS